MYLENLVFDAVEPQRVGRFWEAVVGGDRLTDEPEGYETRHAVEGGPELDLCFQLVPDPPSAPPRLQVHLMGGDRLAEEVDRLLGLGARHLDAGQGDEPGVVLADPEGNRFCVVEDRAAYADTGLVAALRLQSADPGRDAEFWAWLTGWTGAAGAATRSLRHPSLRGPVLELWPESAPKGPDKNRMHLDVRLEVGDDHEALAAGIAQRGGGTLHHPEWGELPWRSYTDPSGNELCLLPARSQPETPVRPG